jgi:hypothetical protein
MEAKMDPELLPKIINSVGLFFDIIGAWLVAWEVVRQFKGQQYEDSMVLMDEFINPPEKTRDFEKWEQDKYAKMKIGLGFLFTGFALQILSNWTCFLF